MLLNEYWAQCYWPTCQRLRECTRVGYESAWHRHIQPALGGIELGELTAPRIQAWLDSIPTAGAARKAWAVLRQMLRSAVRLALLDVDITGRVTPPRPSGYEPQVLDIKQVRQLLQGFHGHELEAWLICSVCLGLRTEEALGLEWGDLNLNTGKVRIQRGVQWVGGHEVIVEPKTELSRRTVVLPRFAVLRLRDIRPREGGRLVGSLNPGQVARRYRSWCAAHDLPYVPRRNLRHSWASTALGAGVDVAVVSRALGHSSIATTARYYLRPDSEVLREAQRLWERALIR
ncbi:site-specific recombinase, phage integrase family [Bifidobacterium saguini DSM 23967]|uniref:Site-specific recombinase, phage integrase family n=2 Tax=Bifidobacterium saguini TaxID=762210 RepID=A0A087DA69_9BIFI|nr:site-specific integrase [Bifidobacterium saguini]KFI92419.1 site-specific recombinase, phage integrase family [Bifidobacterium saguini DSM 23967]QTB90853.1 site-specific integrase [Bifidobacterium saguini]QTB90902.1 site-specific integrase [Bifidobacterium saguini]QTB91103.1 site-specific integrase [Bifidobacterium saguini]